MKKEAKARIKINLLLQEAGWRFFGLKLAVFKLLGLTYLGFFGKIIVSLKI